VNGGKKTRYAIQRERVGGRRQEGRGVSGLCLKTCRHGAGQANKGPFVATGARVLGKRVGREVPKSASEDLALGGGRYL